MARSAGACPSCPTSDVVWATVLGDGFAENLAVTLLPFVVVVALTAAANRALGRRAKRPAVEGENDDA